MSSSSLRSPFLLLRFFSLRKLLFGIFKDFRASAIDENDETIYILVEMELI